MDLGRTLLLAIAASMAVACAPEADDEAEASSDALVQKTGSAHALAVKQCDAAHETARKSAASAPEQVLITTNWTHCLARANDGAVVALAPRAATAYANVSPNVLGHHFKNARKAGESVCVQLDKAALEFGGPAATVKAASCRANWERMLASFIDAYGGLGVQPHVIAERRDQHRECYAAKDADPLHNLAYCVLQEAKALAAPIAEIQIENDPGYIEWFEPRTTPPFLTTRADAVRIATDRVEHRLFSGYSAGKDLCILIIAASIPEEERPQAGQSNYLKVVDCDRKWAESLHAVLKAAHDEHAPR